MPAKILHVAEVMDGGISTYIENLATSQAEIYGDSAIAVLCPSDGLRFLSEAFKARIEVISFERSGRGFSGLSALRKAFTAAVKAWKPAIVHAHSTFAGLVVRGRWSRPYKAIYTPNGWPFSMQMPALAIKLFVVVEKFLARRSDAIVAVSENEASLARVHGLRPKLLEVVHTGILDVPPDCVKAPETQAEDEVTLIMVARFAAQKRQDELLRGLALIPDLPWRVKFVGDGELEPNVRELAAQLGIEDKIDFMGLRPDVPKLLAQADIFALTSFYEGFSLSILEALRAGLPVVASDISGNGEAVTVGENGFLCPSDEPEFLANAVQQLVLSRELRQQYGIAARQAYEQRFKAEAMGRQLDTVIQRVLA